MNISFSPLADREFDDAVRYYEDQAPRLGLDFAEDALAAIERVARFPDAWAPLSKHSRRCILSRFPYGLIYQIRPDQIIIIAVACLHRKPDYWVERESQNN